MSAIIPIIGVAILGSLAVYVLVLALLQLHQEVGRRAYQQAELNEVMRRTERHLRNMADANSAAGPAWQGTRKFVISAKVLECENICSFYLAPHDQQPLPHFMPGQFLTFKLSIASQSTPQIRCYSLSDAPGHEACYRVTIKRIPAPHDQPEAPPGLSSSHFHDHLLMANILDIKAPGGNFYLDSSHDGPVVLIGGGIGVTPVLSMLNYLAESNSAREIWFYYGLRNSSEHVMKEHLHGLRQRLNIHIRICYSNPLENDIADKDYDVAARVSVALLKKDLEVNNFDFYICGPPPMMTALTTDLLAWHVPESRIHFEAFGPASAKKTAASSAKENIEVRFTRSDKVLIWTGEHENLLAFGLANDIPMNSGCRAGTHCGSCTTALRSGDVSYVGSPNIAGVEAGACLTCCAIPKGPITLDA